MAKSEREKLNELIAEYERQLVVATAGKAKTTAEREEFNREFAAQRRDVIRPALEAVALDLKAAGHKTRIAEQERSVDGVGRETPASIELVVTPKPFATDGRHHQDTSLPRTLFVADREKREVWVEASTCMPERGGSGGRRATYRLADLSDELVFRHVVLTLSEAFGLHPKG